MEQLLIDLISNLRATADKRNVAFDNPVLFKKVAPTGVLYDIVVSPTEPGFVTFPFNVVWVNDDADHADYGKIFRRTAKASLNGYNNTWVELTLEADIYSEAQYYDLEDTAMVGEHDLSLTVVTATETRAGLFALSGAPSLPEAPVVVEDNDSRMTDSRQPTAHSHPQLPVTHLKVNASEFININTPLPPEAGQVLMITGFGDLPNEFDGIWRGVTQADIAFVGAALVSLTPQGPVSVVSSGQAYYSAKGNYDDNGIRTISGVWSVVTGSEFATITTEGLLTSVSGLSGNNEVVLEVSYVQPGTVTEVTAQYVIDVNDGVLAPQVVSFEIINGSASVAELGTVSYDFLVTYDDTSTALVTPTTFTSSDPLLVTTNAAAGTATSITDVGTTESVVLTAQFVDADLNTHSDTQALNINDVTAYVSSINILGSNSVDEGTVSQYTIQATYTDTSTAIVTPDSLTSSDLAVGTIDPVTGNFTAGELSSDGTTTLSASYTELGVTKTDTFVVSVVDTTLYPASAVVEGVTGIQENTSSHFSLRVTYTNNTSEVVSGEVWSRLSGTAATIDAVTGTLTAGGVTVDSTVEIQGEYTAEGITVSASKLVSITNVIPTPVSLAVTGDTTVSGGNPGQLTVTATYDDSSSADVTAASGYAVAPGTYLTIDQVGAFTTTDPAANSTETVTIQYTENGTTVQVVQAITVNNSAASLLPMYGNGDGFVAGSLIDEAFLTPILTNTMPDQANGNQITISQTVTEYLYFAIPATLGSLIVTDETAGFVVGLTSATWESEADAIADPPIEAPKAVTIGGASWLLYRASFAGSFDTHLLTIDYS